MSPVHSSIVRYGSSSRFSTSSAFDVSRSSSSYDCLGRRERHQLDLVELVLADQAAHVGAVRSRLAAEARRVRGVADRQLAAVEDLAAVHVRQRHFRGRHQVRSQSPAILNRSASNFGRLPVPVSDARVGHERRLDLGVAVLRRVQVRA